MAESEGLAHTMNELIDSTGGQIIRDARNFLISRIKFIVGIFILGIVIGFPMTKSVISWLIDPSRLPDDVNIIVVSPVEYILLQFHVATSLGAFLVMLYLFVQICHKGIKNESVKKRIKELNFKPPSFGPTIIITVLSVLILALSIVGIYLSF